MMTTTLQQMRALIADDRHAATFQTSGQYRTNLLTAIDEVIRQQHQHNIILGSALHNNGVAMQAAWIEWQHGAGAEEAMDWIHNTLCGPGLIPDEEEPHGTNAQAYFDANVCDRGGETTRMEKLTTQHPDDAAVDHFAIAMKKKLEQARAKGRSGWQTCPPADLSRLLREHVDKGDPRDVGNFCAFLWALEAPIEKPGSPFELTLVAEESRNG